MAVAGVSTPAVFAAGVGALVLWAGLKGMSVTGGIRSLLTGQQPTGANVYPIQGGAVSGGAAGTTNSDVANDAMRYLNSGSVYKWGGGSPSGWDCSGFVNWVVGHDLGRPIPGSSSGSYSGHGPVTMQWALFGNSVPRGQVQAGDLVVWPMFHMGIAISNAQMINCPGPNGSPAPVIGNIDGGGPGVVTYRRL